MKTLLHSNLIAALVGAALMLYAQVSAAPFVQPNSAGAATSQYVPGEVLVKFKPAAIAQERTATIAALGHTVVTHLGQPGWMHVKLGTGQSVTEALVVYQNNPNVEAVQPNYIYRAAAVPNDTQYGQLWAFKNTGQNITTGTFNPTSGTAGDDMNIERAWDHITDCSGVVVAVVDSGVNYNQEDLAANMWSSDPNFPNHGWNYVNNNNDPMDLDGHGTHVAGIIGAAGNNGKGTTGICWKASIMAVRVLDATGSGSDATIILGINFAIAQGARVISMSLGSDVPVDPAFSDAITSAQTNDIVVTVSAGNKAKDNDAVTAHFPCNFTQPNLVCVAALDQNYALANFSNWGATSVDVGAPGTNILSTWAGAATTINDTFNTGGFLNWTINGGWGYRVLTLSSGRSVDALVDPAATFPSGVYGNNVDNRAYKTFNLAGVDVAILQASAIINVVNGDHFRTGYAIAGGDPFAGAGTLVDDTTGVATYPNFAFGVFDISGCISANCSIGYQLQSGAAAPKDRGLAIAGFSIQTLTLDATSYNTISGTSMATPEVAGLAVMLRAYNPQYTYADTVNAIKNGGRSVAALAGKTTTGKAVDVMSSLAYINPPTGLTATVQ